MELVALPRQHAAHAPVTYSTGAQPQTADDIIVAALLRGDEHAFAQLVERHQRAMLRVALPYVSSYALAEEVVQETWLGLLGSLRRFEGRSSLKTWLYRILINRAKTCGAREGRTVPFSALRPSESGDASGDSAQLDEVTEQWAVAPQRWESGPEARLLAQETRAHLQRAIDALPEQQRAVITLRDVAGWSSEEVCDLLRISEVNQRVLLHRARTKVRSVLERYLSTAEAA